MGYKWSLAVFNSCFITVPIICFWFIECTVNIRRKSGMVWFMMFDASFNNILATLWRSILLVEETGVPGKTHRTDVCCIEYTSPWWRFELTTLVVIFIDCTGSYKSNYHTISTTTTPLGGNQMPQLNTLIHCIYLIFWAHWNRFHNI